MVEVAEVVVLGEDIQFMLFQLGVGIARQRDRVEIDIFKRQFQLFRSRADKAGIKVCIVRDQRQIADERKELRQCLVDRGRVRHHFVGDTRQLHDVLRNRHLGVD